MLQQSLSRGDVIAPKLTFSFQMATVKSVKFKRRKSCGSLECQVVLLDNSLYVTKLDGKSAKGQELFNKVCEKLSLPPNTRNYFGLQFIDGVDGELTWLDFEKEIRPQRRKPYTFQFAVRFYPLEANVKPKEVQELLIWQIKDSLIRGKFITSINEHAVLDGFFAQAVLGDFNPKLHTRGYLEDLLGSFFAPPNRINCDAELSEEKYESIVYNLHRSHKGMTPGEARIAFLEMAYNLPFCGMSLHHGATDKNGNIVYLAICGSGVLVFDVDTFGVPGNVVQNFPWHEIVAMTRQNRKFYVVVYSHERKDGGSYSYRFHGHFGHRASERILHDALRHQAVFYQPEKKLFRRSKSFGEVDSHIGTGQFKRSDKKYASTFGKTPSRGSFRKFTDSIRRKIPHKQKSAPADSSLDESPNTSNTSTMTYV